MQAPMKALRRRIVAPFSMLLVAFGLLAASPPAPAQAAEPGVKWLVEYRAEQMPAPGVWKRLGSARAELGDGALRIADDSADDQCCFRAEWPPAGDQEIIVEASARVGSIKAWRGGSRQYAWREGSSASILVCDGSRQEGLLLCPERISSYLDRFSPFDAAKQFHDYRIVIRGEDMSIYADGELKIRGRDAFWKPAEGQPPFIQFGSSSKPYEGESFWRSVRLGVRPAPALEAKPLKITLSEPWLIPGFGRYQTRPYVYNLGRGLLMLSVAQGPDKWYEPYGILRSTDAGKTWSPVKDLQLKTFAPQPMIRLADGSILGVSRWNVKYDDGVYVGVGYRFDPAWRDVHHVREPDHGPEGHPRDHGF